MENPDKKEEENFKEDENQSQKVQKLDLNESNTDSKDKKEKEKLPMIDSNENETPELLGPPVKIERGKRRKSTFVDVEKAKKEAESLLKGDEPTGAKANLLFEEKSITIFRLYGHLNRPIDYFFMVLALIGSLGSGISMPIQAYISSDLF